MFRWTALILSWFFTQTCFASLTLQQLQSDLQKQIASLTSATTPGFYVEVLGTGQQIFANDAEQVLIPASASKLITTSAALTSMGPNFTYQTVAIQQGNDIVLMGNGDPNFTFDGLTAMAKTIAQKTKHVANIWINNSAYAQDYNGLEQFTGFDWEVDAPIVSATSLNENIVQINVTPTASGTPTLQTQPSGSVYALITSTVTQVAGSANNLHIQTQGMVGNQEAFLVSGTIGNSAGMQTAIESVQSPEAHIAYGLAAALESFGVIVDNPYAGVSFQPVSPGDPILATNVSQTLNELADNYMTVSDNYMAEQVFQTVGTKILGGPASITQSEQAATQYLKNIPACSAGVMTNGSGLTWTNEISPHCFIANFQTLYPQTTIYSDLIASLPVGGKTGTLAGRFVNPPAGFQASWVHAKTGTIWSQVGVSALIGLTKIQTGQTVLFALVENDTRNTEAAVDALKTWEDSCVELIQQLSL